MLHCRCYHFKVILKFIFVFILKFILVVIVKFIFVISSKFIVLILLWYWFICTINKIFKPAYTSFEVLRVQSLYNGDGIFFWIFIGFFVGNNTLNIKITFSGTLENFWRATHFVAVFCEGNNTLTTQYNIFWDLEIFWRATHFVAVFC